MRKFFSQISAVRMSTHAYMDATPLFASNNESLLHWSSDNGFFGSAWLWQGGRMQMHFLSLYLYYRTWLWVKGLCFIHIGQPLYFGGWVLFPLLMLFNCCFVVQTFKGPMSSQALSSLLQDQVHGPTTAPITVSVSSGTWTWCMIGTADYYPCLPLYSWLAIWLCHWLLCLLCKWLPCYSAWKTRYL